MRKRTSIAGAGEIVQVHGSRILRPGGGSKDRHTKVCTSKGTRDRRVRLSANTAIQFYDIQDRLGYDRPSSAVDWLLSKAKSAIDELAELPNADGSPPSVDKSVQFHSHSQDLKLSLQSLEESHSQNQNLLSEAAQFGFDNDNNNPIGWINSQQPLWLGQAATQMFTQREPLQSSISPSVRARIDGNSFGSTSNSSQDYHHQAMSINSRSLSGIGFASSGGFSARIRSDQEDNHDGLPY